MTFSTPSQPLSIKVEAEYHSGLFIIATSEVDGDDTGAQSKRKRETQDGEGARDGKKRKGAQVVDMVKVVTTGHSQSISMGTSSRRLSSELMSIVGSSPLTSAPASIDAPRHTGVDGGARQHVPLFMTPSQDTNELPPHGDGSGFGVEDMTVQEFDAMMEDGNTDGVAGPSRTGHSEAEVLSDDELEASQIPQTQGSLREDGQKVCGKGPSGIAYLTNASLTDIPRVV
jgi:hypothetical protein